MFWLKKCPRCSGDLYQSSDNYGDFIACLQCGKYLNEGEQARLGLPNARQDRPNPVPDRARQLVA